MMSSTATEMTEQAPGPAPHGRWAGRSALIIPGVLFALGVFLIVGISDMEIVDDSELFGPRAFPWMIAVACFVVGALLTISIVRNPEAMADRDGVSVAAAPSNWKATGITIGSLIVFAILLEPVGWIIAGALVFWGVTIGLGSRKYVTNLLIGLALSSIMQLIFAGLLGLSLPPGLMGLF